MKRTKWESGKGGVGRFPANSELVPAVQGSEQHLGPAVSRGVELRPELRPTESRSASSQPLPLIQSQTPSVSFSLCVTGTIKPILQIHFDVNKIISLLISSLKIFVLSHFPVLGAPLYPNSSWFWPRTTELVGAPSSVCEADWQGPSGGRDLLLDFPGLGAPERRA